MGLLVILDIVGDEYLLPAMLRAVFYHIDVIVAEDYFGLDFLQTMRAKGVCGIVEEIVALWHGVIYCRYLSSNLVYGADVLLQ